MSKSIKPEELQKELQKYLMQYREDIQEDVEEVVDKVTKEARDELKEKSPRRKGVVRNTQYYKGWTVKLSKRGTTKYHKVVWNRTNYQLTHLLEFGHHKRDGTGWVDAQPHIRDVEKKYNVEFVDLINERIRRRSKK